MCLLNNNLLVRVQSRYPGFSVSTEDANLVMEAREGVPLRPLKLIVPPELLERAGSENLHWLAPMVDHNYALRHLLGLGQLDLELSVMFGEYQFEGVPVPQIRLSQPQEANDVLVCASWQQWVGGQNLTPERLRQRDFQDFRFLHSNERYGRARWVVKVLPEDALQAWLEGCQEAWEKAF